MCRRSMPKPWSNAQLVISDLSNPHISISSILKCNKAHPACPERAEDLEDAELPTGGEAHRVPSWTIGNISGVSRVNRRPLIGRRP